MARSPASTSARAEQSSAASRNTSPARTPKWVRPTVAVHARLSSRSAPPSESHNRYRPASRPSASGVLAASGKIRARPCCSAASFRCGYPSTNTCAFVPERPNELTAPRIRRPLRRGQRVGSVTTRTGNSPHSIRGFGSSKWSWRAITPSSSASTSLISPAIPAASSRWPTFVFTEPSSSGRFGDRPRPYTPSAASTSTGSPSGVPDP